MNEPRIKLGGEYADQQQVEQEKWQYVHPLEQPEVRQYIKEVFPESAELLDSITFPRLSSHPDELEEWEAEHIQQRKKRGLIETDFKYLARSLYEECFSVDQHPWPEKQQLCKGSPGMTVGGLISHFINEDENNGYTIGDIMNLPIKGNSLSEVYAVILQKKDYVVARAFLNFVTMMSFQKKSLSLSRLEKGSIDFCIRMVSEGKDNYPDLYDSVGFRLIKLLSAITEMSKEVADPKLKKLVGVKVGKALSKFSLVRLMWLRSQRLLKGDVYKDEEDVNAQQALKDLLFYRTHPEMQIFFKYFSPSGYLNDML